MTRQMSARNATPHEPFRADVCAWLIRTHGLFSNILPYDERVSDKRENNDVYGPTPDIAESSPRGDPDLRRGCPNPPHAGEARWNPNCSAEAKNELKDYQVRT